MVKNEKFQCPSERGGPEDFKNHPTFVPSAIFGGVMASQNMVNFFLGHPVCTLLIFLLSESCPPHIHQTDVNECIHTANVEQ